MHMARDFKQEHTWSMMSREKSVPDSVMMPSLIRRPPAEVTCRLPLLTCFESDRRLHANWEQTYRHRRKPTFVEVLAGADLLL